MKPEATADASSVMDLKSAARPAIDIIIPVYGERLDALLATLSACAKQTYAVSNIFVVDDGSPQPITLSSSHASGANVYLLRLSENRGISAARNEAIARSRTQLLACINAEVLPAPDWLATCAGYLASNPNVGACFARLLPSCPERILTRWRMRFQEPAYGEQSGAVPFAHGHAVLFRREAVDAVGGYDIRFRRHHEDSDICQRMKNLGWESHYVAHTSCVSIQSDSLRELAGKQLRDSNWYSPEESSLFRLYGSLTKWTLIRAGRNLVKGRVYFLPIDVAIWAYALSIATIRTLRHALRTKK
jgi:cellulose synthase (UDP-forming)